MPHLKNIYLGSVGRNATLMVGLGPNRSGVMAAADVKPCKARKFRLRILKDIAEPDIRSFCVR